MAGSPTHGERCPGRIGHREPTSCRFPASFPLFWTGLTWQDFQSAGHHADSPHCNTLHVAGDLVTVAHIPELALVTARTRRRRVRQRVRFLAGGRPRRGQVVGTAVLAGGGSGAAGGAALDHGDRDQERAGRDGAAAPSAGSAPCLPCGGQDRVSEPPGGVRAALCPRAGGNRRPARGIGQQRPQPQTPLRPAWPAHTAQPDLVPGTGEVPRAGSDDDLVVTFPAAVQGAVGLAARRAGRWRDAPGPSAARRRTLTRRRRRGACVRCCSPGPRC
jgi:hypothetical protein